MKLTLLAAACAALLVLALGFWNTLRDGGGTRANPAASAASEARPAAAPAVLAPALEPDALPSRRSAVAAAHPEPAAPRAARVLARSVDSGGQPLAGVTVTAEGRFAGTSTPDGRIALELVPEASDDFFMLELRLPGFARARRGVRLSAGVEVHLGEIALASAASLSGRVEDERGRPLAGVRLVTTSLENPRTDAEELRRLGPLEEERSVAGESGPDGRFRLDDVPLGPARLWGGSEALAWSALGPLEVASGGVRDLVLVLRPLLSLDVIRGRVLSPEGEPVARAEVGYWFAAADFSTGGGVVADEHGVFEILLQQRVAHDLTASDPENRWSEVYHMSVEPGTQELELVFEPARWMEVSVRDPGGAALDGFTLGLRSHIEHNWLQMTPSSDAPREGRTRLRVPNAPFVVTAAAHGREQVERGPFRPENAPATLALELAALPGVHGLVRTRTGQPAAGAKIGLYRTIPERLEVEHDGFRLTLESNSASNATTDAEGRFVLYPPTGKALGYETDLFVLRATAPGHAPTELGPRAFDPHERVELELQLVGGGAIEGRATTAPGVDPIGVLLAFHRGDGKVQTQRLGPDGRYRLEQLTPGPWEVRALDDERYGSRSGSRSTLHDGPVPPFDGWSCVVVEGETTRYDVDLGERAPCTLRGELAFGGRALEGWTASLELPGSYGDVVLAAVALDERGRFELVAPRGGRHRLALRGPEEAHGRLELTEELELHPGELAWRVALEPSRLEGGGARGSGTRERFYAYEWFGAVPGHELQARVRILPGADGSFVLPCLPAGRGKILRNDPPAQGQSIAPWSELAEFELRPGEGRRIDLP